MKEIGKQNAAFSELHDNIHDEMKHRHNHFLVNLWGPRCDRRSRICASDLQLCWEIWELSLNRGRGHFGFLLAFAPYGTL